MVPIVQSRGSPNGVIHKPNRSAVTLVALSILVSFEAYGRSFVCGRKPWVARPLLSRRLNALGGESNWSGSDPSTNEHAALAAEHKLLRSQLKILTEEIRELRKSLSSSSVATEAPVQEPARQSPQASVATGPRPAAAVPAPKPPVPRQSAAEAAPPVPPPKPARETAPPPKPAREAASPGPPPKAARAAAPAESSATSAPDVAALLEGKSFAWCHGGRERTGQISLEANGRTGAMAPAWTLTNWRVTGPHEVTLENANGGNQHILFFNAQLTGYYCDQAGQRGFVEGRGFYSPDEAGAPHGPTEAGMETAVKEKNTPVSSGAPAKEEVPMEPEVQKKLDDIYDRITAKRFAVSS